MAGGADWTSPFNGMTLANLKVWARYLGPGMLVTVGFIDPGNWACNVAAGAGFGYTLLWMVTLSTMMLILLQHNAAHLGIATGLCLSEAATQYLPRWVSRPVLGSAMAAAVSTALAEILGGAIALNMLFGLPLPVGAVLVAGVAAALLFSHSYQRIEKLILGFVTVIGLSFLYELWLVKLDWGAAVAGWVHPVFPSGSMMVIMSVLGAVVMPHNLFLHSEIIQSRHWNLKDESVIRQQMRGELFDTLTGMWIGWAINSAMILLAAATFFQAGTQVTELGQAERMLRPLLGQAAAVVFAVALLFSGLASTITAGMAGGSIGAGMAGTNYNIRRHETLLGMAVTLGGGLLALLLVRNPFKGLLISQMLLSIQLPFTILTQIRLTASRRVMGAAHANTWVENLSLGVVAAVVITLNLLLLLSWIQAA